MNTREAIQISPMPKVIKVDPSEFSCEEKSKIRRRIDILDGSWLWHFFSWSFSWLWHFFSWSFSPEIIGELKEIWFESAANGQVNKIYFIIDELKNKTWRKCLYDSKNAHGDTLLHIAIKHNLIDLAKRLAQCDVSTSIANNEGMTQYRLMWILRRDEICTFYPKDLSLLNEAIMKNNVAEMRRYLEYIHPDFYQYDFLMTAVTGSHFEATISLLEYGATILPNAISHVLRTGKKSFIDLFISHGLDLNDTYDDDTQRPYWFDLNHNILQEYKNRIDFAGTDNNGDTFLMKHICYTQYSPIVPQLKALGVPINHQNRHGNTALILATAAGCARQVRDLLNNGADALIKNCDGRKALDWARGECKDMLSVRNTDLSAQLHHDTRLPWRHIIP